MDWKELDAKVNLEEIKDEEVKFANRSEGEFEDVPCGSYEVKIEKMETKFSNSGKPMFSCWFRIIGVNDRFKNHLIFMNQIIERGFQFHIVNDFLRSLESGIGDIQFTSYAEYAELVERIFNAVDGKKEYALKYGENSKGFNTYDIFKVFEV